jgi:hypothetical protein
VKNQRHTGKIDNTHIQTERTKKEKGKRKKKKEDQENRSGRLIFVPRLAHMPS